VTARDYLAPEDAAAGGFERVANVADIPEGTLRAVTRTSGRPVCLYNSAGRIGAIAELCTHQAFPMAEGVLLPNGRVQCSWHGATFDCASGEVCEGPADEPLAVYETRVRDGEIWVGPAR
jgi:nitrite reductase/ring-hydroxylating ferredoxin subunit